MFRIGDFSRLSLVSVKTLRFYDEKGLLKPARIDEFTGYRYYTANQLPRLNRILTLKDMGLSLEEIAQLLDKDLTTDQIRGMLLLKQVELRQQLTLGQTRLARMEAWLQTIEQEAKLPAYDVVLKQIAPLQVARIQGVASSMERIGPTLDHLFDQLMGELKQQGVTTVEPPITVYTDPEMRDQGINLAACIAFRGKLVENEQVRVCELPGVQTMASVIHHGSFTTIQLAYKALLNWIEANDYHINGSNRELNLAYERGGDQEKFVTEIQFPVEWHEA